MGGMKHEKMYQYGSTLILKVAVIALGLVVLSLCFGLLLLATDGEQNYRNPLWIGLIVSAVPFFVALFQSLKLIGHIDKGTIFSPAAVNHLKNIKYCALIISGMFLIGSPVIMQIAQRDDAPGLFAIALVLMGASFVIATAASVFQHLLASAVAIKSENDLTV